MITGSSRRSYSHIKFYKCRYVCERELIFYIIKLQSKKVNRQWRRRQCVLTKRNQSVNNSEWQHYHSEGDKLKSNGDTMSHIINWWGGCYYKWIHYSYKVGTKDAI